VTRILDVITLLLLSSRPLRTKHFKEALRLVGLVAAHAGSRELGVSTRALDHLYGIHLVLTKQAAAAAASGSGKRGCS
jgi:hypothetical protein